MGVRRAPRARIEVPMRFTATEEYGVRCLVQMVRELDGPLYAEPEFCGKHTGTQRVCVHTTDCNIRGLWRAVDGAVQRTLSRTRLRDLLGPERAMLGAPVATPAVG